MKKTNVKIYNFSSEPLDQDQIEVLKLGQKFVPTSTVTEEQIKIDILNFSRSLLLKANFYNNKDTDESLIHPVSNYIPKNTPYQVIESIVNDLESLSNDIADIDRREIDDNLSKSQRKGLNKLKNSHTSIYLPADKGGAPVWIDKIFYKKLMEDKLSSSTYEKLDRNEDYFVNIELGKLAKKYKQILTKKEKLAIYNFDYRSANIYGLPKIHKSKLVKEAIQDCEDVSLHLPQPADLSLRLIFGGPKSPTTGLANLVDLILKPYLSKIAAKVIDVFHFLRRMPIFCKQDLPFTEMGSVYFKEMYPSIDQDLRLFNFLKGS